MTIRPAATAEASGHAELVAAWFESLGQGLYRYLLRLLGDQDLAADLLQETFERALRSLGRRPPPDNPSAWLYRVAANLAYDALRRRRRLRWLPLGGLEHAVAAGDPAAAAAVRDCLARLSPPEAEALLLYEYAGLSCVEIGGLLDVAPATVRVRLHRARERFRKLYGED